MIILIPCNVAAPLASDHGFLIELIFLHTFSWEIKLQISRQFQIPITNNIYTFVRANPFKAKSGFARAF
jgi:hypothetical protein